MSFGPRLNQIFDARKVRLAGECERIAGVALKDMQDFQATNEFESSKLGWDNETKQAMQTLFSGPIHEPDAEGFFVAHKMDYGVYLELKDDRKHELLRPTAEKYSVDLVKSAKDIYQ